MGRNSRTSRIHVVYRTTCQADGTVYIGKHSQKTIDFDGYLGSGTLLRAKIAELGKDKFTIKVLSVHETKEEAFAEETRQIALYRASGHLLLNKAKNEGHTDTRCFDCKGPSSDYKAWPISREQWLSSRISLKGHLCQLCFENRVGYKLNCKLL